MSRKHLTVGGMKKEALQRKVLGWFEKNKRDFYWREDGISTYELLIAEMLLQKTQAKRVEPVLKEFIARYPNIESIHMAPRKEIEKLIWKLGLFRRRSKKIKEAAEIVVKKHGGSIEAARVELEELPGVGSYISSAIACFKDGKAVPVVDANVGRVVGRLFGIDYKNPKHSKELWQKAGSLVPEGNPRSFNWAVIDLGALVCKPQRPKCCECPLKNACSTGPKSQGYHREDRRKATCGYGGGQKVATCIDGNREEFEYPRSGKSVVRVVHLADGRKVSTRIQIKNMGLNGGDARSVFEYAFLRDHRPQKQLPSSPVVRVVDCFCGCGGLSLGAMEACRSVGRKFFPIAAIDKDPIALEVYKRNFRCRRTYPKDITAILDGGIGSKPTDKELVFLNEVKDVDILLAGPPCQGYSDLNNYTRRDDSRNVLYESVARFVEIAKPKHVLIENVPTVIYGKERAVQRSIEVMKEMGYRVDSGIVDLTTIGVPQKRKRHVLIASASKTISVENVMEKYRVEPERSVRWAIGDLEDEPQNGSFTTPSRNTEDNMRRIKYLHDKDVYDLPNRLRPQCHRDGGHSYKSMYGRLRWDRPAQTITSGFGSPGQGRFVHPTKLRTLTPHEAARLQFFPDFFDFSQVKKRTALSEMIGNAAPMKLSYVFCLELLA